jgi:hypothetical protein
MYVSNASPALFDHFTDDEVLAIRFALRDRADLLRLDATSAKYANFLDIIGEKLASLQDLDC